MNIKYLKILIPLWSIAIIAFVYFNSSGMNILPMLAVLCMAAGFNYALLKYLRTIPTESNQKSMKRFNQFEENVKIAKPLRMTGSILFMILMVMWLDLVEFKYEGYFSLVVMAILLTYVLWGVIFFNKQPKSQN
ncbi:hypothetical protein [uncultured Algoriphagus sp.]|uniref:hypothetical protein n=1 Tax=uncultured Algoriphagus sp. TaxID=417365 RepID=UPI0030EC6D8B